MEARRRLFDPSKPGRPPFNPECHICITIISGRGVVYTYGQIEKAVIEPDLALSALLALAPNSLRDGSRRSQMEEGGC
jgi:hypothetical protein